MTQQLLGISVMGMEEQRTGQPNTTSILGEEVEVVLDYGWEFTWTGNATLRLSTKKDTTDRTSKGNLGPLMSVPRCCKSFLQ